MPVHQRLVRLPAQHEARRLRGGPRPHWRVGPGLGQCSEQPVRGVATEGEQVVVALRPGRSPLLGDLGRLQPPIEDLGPEAVDLGEVPQQVGRRPVRARGHPSSRIGVPEHDGEALRLGGDVREVVQWARHVGSFPVGLVQDDGRRMMADGSVRQLDRAVGAQREAGVVRQLPQVAVEIGNVTGVPAPEHALGRLDQRAARRHPRRRGGIDRLG